jgi:hypothetical protein
MFHRALTDEEGQMAFNFTYPDGLPRYLPKHEQMAIAMMFTWAEIGPLKLLGFLGQWIRMRVLVILLKLMNWEPKKESTR